MSIINFLKSRKNMNTEYDSVLPEEKKTESENSGGVRFPWEAIFFMAIGLLSELVDALLMQDTLDILAPGLEGSMMVSLIIGGSCFLSMAFVGFQLANRKYYSKTGVKISYAFWLIAGIVLVTARVLAGLTRMNTDASPLDDEEFRKNLVIAGIQFAVYIGTGFMTRDSVKILTDNDMREYFLAKQQLEDLIDELADSKAEIMEDVARLKAYHKYAERLVESKKSAKQNIAQYNESAKALIEIDMSIVVDPDFMEDIYDKTIEKEKNGMEKQYESHEK